MRLSTCVKGIIPNINVWRDAVATLGLSYDNYSERDIDISKVSPKLGLQWQVTPNLTLRGAAFRTVPPPLLTDRTIQPTQVAGFNQLFNDWPASEAWRYAVACDARLSDSLSAGIELSKRQIQENIQFIFSDDPDFKEQRSEKLAHAYVYVTPLENIALSIDGIYDKYDSQKSDAYFIPNVTTISSPISIRYFSRLGIFAGATWTYIHQKVNAPEYGLDYYSEGTSNFNLIDAVIGYRLPKRFGIISLQGTNLLGQSFKFQDDSFRTSNRNQYYSPYLPDRGVLLRLTLNLQAF